MKAIHLLFVFFLAINCSPQKAEDVELILYTSDGKMINKLDINDIKQVNWETQCYHICEEKSKELSSLDLHYCRFDLSFKKKVLASISVFDLYSSNMPDGYFTYMESVVESGTLCIYKLHDVVRDIHQNKDYKGFLRDAGILTK